MFEAAAESRDERRTFAEPRAVRGPGRWALRLRWKDLLQAREGLDGEGLRVYFSAATADARAAGVRAPCGPSRTVRELPGGGGSAAIPLGVTGSCPARSGSGVRVAERLHLGHLLPARRPSCSSCARIDGSARRKLSRLVGPETTMRPRTERAVRLARARRRRVHAGQADRC